MRKTTYKVCVKTAINLGENTFARLWNAPYIYISNLIS